MFNVKYVFAQLVAFLNRSKFNRIVAKYEGYKYVKHFTFWNQLLAMMLGQLFNRASLRDLITILEAHNSKCYHFGLGKIYPEPTGPMQTRIGITLSLRSSHYMIAEAREKRKEIYEFQDFRNYIDFYDKLQENGFEIERPIQASVQYIEDSI